jgi:putative sigma-54 modulation protein
MFEEDALERMEELGHHFFIFVNAESERLCVLYKRCAGDYGLIEPVLGGGYTPDRNGHRAG